MEIRNGYNIVCTLFLYVCNYCFVAIGAYIVLQVSCGETNSDYLVREYDSFN